MDLCGPSGDGPRVRPRPTPRHPLRAFVTSGCAYAVWSNPDHARRFSDHPGRIPELVDAYLAWAEEQA